MNAYAYILYVYKSLFLMLYETVRYYEIEKYYIAPFLKATTKTIIFMN